MNKEMLALSFGFAVLIAATGMAEARPGVTAVAQDRAICTQTAATP
jgi:hypothetical protein